MTLRTLTRALDVNPEVASPSLKDVLTELQGLSFNVVSGAAAATNIAVSGIATADTLAAVIEFAFTTGNVTGVNDRSGEASITSAGNIQLSTTDTTGSKLLVIWFNQA